MAGVAVAQDMAQATELAKQANESLVNGDNEAALAGFRQALEQASLCGEEGFDLVTTCKSVIPKILLNQAKASIAANEFDAAVEKLKETASVATEYEQVDAAEEANALVPQVLLQKANQLLNAKDYNGAVSAYKDVLDVDPANGNAYLRMGMAYNGMNNLDSAIDAFVLTDGKVFDTVLRVINVSTSPSTLSLPSGYAYERLKGTAPLTIPALSTNLLTITRTADRVFFVAREELEAAQ